MLIPTPNETGNETGIEMHPTRYQGWLISTKLINNQVWVRWQHPAENFPRYSYPVANKGLADTIRYVRFLIDIAIKLESSATQENG